MPSPTIAVSPYSCEISDKALTYPPAEARYIDRPTDSVCYRLCARRLSPVSMTIFLTPWACKSATSPLAS